MTEPDPRIVAISATYLLGDDDGGATPDGTLASLLHCLADRLETDPVTSWTEEGVYAGLFRLAEAAETTRRKVAVVRGNRPPSEARRK